MESTTKFATMLSSAMSSLRSIRVASSSSPSSVTLLLLAVVLMMEVVGCRAMPTTPQPRWLQPCSGETPQGRINVSATANVVDTMTTEERQAVASLLASIAANRLRAVSDSTTRLRRLVQALKIKYVEKKRFVDANHADDILRTYPGPTLTNLLSPSSTAFVTEMILSAAYESLARLSLFIERAKTGEDQETGQHVSLQEDYELIQNDPAGGIYQLLCNLKAVMIDRDIHLSSTTQTAIRQMNVGRQPNTNRHARHVEDYGVLDSLEKLLNDLATCLSRMS